MAAEPVRPLTIAVLRCECRSYCGPSAVDDKGLPGHVAGGVGGEEEQRGVELVALRSAAEQRAVADGLREGAVSQSPTIVCIRFPQCCSSSSRRSARRAVAMTWAPAACSTRANRAPGPAEAPVTSATRPSSRHLSLVPAPGTAGSASFIVPPVNRGARAQCSARDDLGRACGRTS